MERYLNRELDEAESDWFEAYLLDRPGLVDQVKSETKISAATNERVVHDRRNTWLPLAMSAVAVLALSGAYFKFTAQEPSWDVPEVLRIEGVRGLDVHRLPLLPNSTRGDSPVLFEIIGPQNARTMYLSLVHTDKTTTRLGPVASNDGVFFVLVSRESLSGVLRINSEFSRGGND